MTTRFEYGQFVEVVQSTPLVAAGVVGQIAWISGYPGPDQELTIEWGSAIRRNRQTVPASAVSSVIVGVGKG